MNIILRTAPVFFLLLFASLSFSLQTAAAAEQQADTEQSQSVKKQYYIVEVILFRHLNEQGKLDEFWHRPDIFGDGLSGNNEFNINPANTYPTNSASANILTDDSPALAEYDMQNRRFLPLRNGIGKTPTENYKLTDSAAHLRYSPDYKLLAHFGWTQRSLSKNQALPIRITSKQFSDSLIPDGELKLYVSRYLHLQVALKASQCDYNITNEEQEQSAEREPGEPADSSQCVNNVYQFKQNRKMRSRELHYIDNPVFGLLVYVTPFTVNKETATKETVSEN